MKRRVCMKRLRRLKCKCHETRHFVRNEMSRIVIFLSWKKVTNRDFFFVVRNGPKKAFSYGARSFRRQEPKLAAVIERSTAAHGASTDH